MGSKSSIFSFMFNPSSAPESHFSLALYHFFSISAVLGLSVPFQPPNITRGGSFNLISKGVCGGVSYLIMAWIYGCKLGLSFSYSKSPHSNHYSISSHSHTIADKLHVSPQLVLRRTVGTVAANLYQTQHCR